MTAEAVAVVKISVLLFLTVAPRGFVGRDKCFEGTYCLHL